MWRLGTKHWAGMLFAGIALTMIAYALAGGAQRAHAVYAFPEAGYGCAEEWGPFGSRSGTISFTPPPSLERTYTQGELKRCYPPGAISSYIIAGIGAALSLAGAIGAGVTWLRAGVRWRGSGDMLVAGGASFVTAIVLIGVPVMDALANICFIGCAPSPTDPFDVIFVGYLISGILIFVTSIVLLTGGALRIALPGNVRRRGLE